MLLAAFRSARARVTRCQKTLTKASTWVLNFDTSASILLPGKCNGPNPLTISGSTAGTFVDPQCTASASAKERRLKAINSILGCVAFVLVASFCVAGTLTDGSK